jgi:hypothetical protein
MFSEYSIKMADLYQAYGGGSDDYSTNFFDEEQQMSAPARQKMAQQDVYQAPQVQQAPAPVQQAPAPKRQQPAVEQFQNLDNLQDYYKPPVPAVAYKRNPSYSFWDRMSMKRPEVIKLAVFGLVIVLAISLERIGTHYLGKYLSDNMLTDFQEFMLRFSYPVMVFLLLWIIKAM